MAKITTKRSSGRDERARNRRSDLDVVEEQLVALYGGRSRYVNARLAPATIVALDRVARTLSRTAGRRISRASALRAIVALGIVSMDRIDAARSAS